MISNQVKTAVIICRVSTKDQEVGYSLDAQEKLLIQYAIDSNYKTESIYRISESASGKMVRKKFLEILSFIKKKNISLILCEKIDRLTRNPKDAATVQDWVNENKQHEVHFVKENFILNQNTKAHENLVWDMKVAVARFYSNNLSEEVRKGQKEKLAQGWLPQKPPPGYLSSGQKGQRTHVIDPVNASYIRQMFDLYSTGKYSILRLEDILFTEGFRSRNGNKVLQSRIYELLCEPFYCGQIKWNGVLYPGKHEPLISSFLFNKVQNILHDRGRKSICTKHDPLFKGKMTCLGCSGRVSWEYQKNHWYGHCNNHLKSRHCPLKTYVREELIDDQIKQLFSQMPVLAKGVETWIEDIIHNSEAEYQERVVLRRLEIASSLNKVKKQKEKYYEAKIDKEIDGDYLNQRIKECLEEENKLKNALRIMEQNDSSTEKTLSEFNKMGWLSKELYSNADPDLKKILISLFFTNLTQNRLEITPEYTEIGKYFFVWLPQLIVDYEPKNTLSPKEYSSQNPSIPALMLAWRDKLRTEWQIFIAENPNFANTLQPDSSSGLSIPN